MERVFQIFDKDDSGSISFQEFIDAIHQFAGQTPEDKIKFLFKVYDIDGKMKSDSILLHIRRGVEVNIFIIVNILLPWPPNKVEVKNSKLHRGADTFAFVTNPVSVLMVK